MANDITINSILEKLSPEEREILARSSKPQKIAQMEVLGSGEIRLTNILRDSGRVFPVRFSFNEWTQILSFHEQIEKAILENKNAKA